MIGSKLPITATLSFMSFLMIILISISLVSVINITSSLERRDVKECEEQQELAVSLAKIYFSLEEGSKAVTVGTLDNKGYFKENDKRDRLKDTDEITIGNNKYLYNGKDVGESCKSN